jgi:uncharacterized Zn-binding protein involved in type VI secretion
LHNTTNAQAKWRECKVFCTESYPSTNNKLYYNQKTIKQFWRDIMPPAARLGDKIVAVDTHIIMIPSPGGPVPTPLPHPYNGTISLGCSTNVMIEGKPAAVVGSSAMAVHAPQGGPFQVPPTGEGKVLMGSGTVMINNKPAARVGDTCMTCNDPAPLPIGKIVPPGSPKVMIGG